MEKNTMILFIMVFALGLSIVGCEKKQSDKTDTPAGSVVQGSTVPVLCAKCGEIKGSEKCCKPDAERCLACGLNKGSPACCKDIDFSRGDVELCTHCGEVKGSARCCVMGVEKCPVCGLNKGSPGCCKIKKQN